MTCDKVHSFIIEFTDQVFVDAERDSVLISFDKKYFNIIETQYKLTGYKLVHMTSFKKGTRLTCVFLKDC
jgi:hypothetical protein